MFFNIDSDSGHAISGWLVLDNPAAIPKIRVVAPGREDVILEARGLRADIKELGIHVTGEVGFNITSDIIPDLESVKHLRLEEAESRLPFFARMEGHAKAKLYLFDCSAIPDQNIVKGINDAFSLSYLSTQGISLETMLTIIANHSAESIAMYGRSSFNRYDTYLSGSGFIRAALLNDPYQDLAERILFIKLASRPVNAGRFRSELLGLESLVEFASEIYVDDPKAILNAFRSLEKEQKRALANPATRLFGCNIDEAPERSHISVALENLAKMDVVGVKTHYLAFRELIHNAIGRSFLSATCQEIVVANTLADILRKTGPAIDLIEHDLELYSYTARAIEAGLSGQSGNYNRDTYST